MFPEGTTTDGSDVLPFKSSLLQPIVEAGGHVQPVAIRYRAANGEACAAAAYVGDDSFCGIVLARDAVSERWSSSCARRPRSPRGERHRRDLARDAERAIRAALGEPADATAPGTRAGREGAPR